jgi:hypothetical protein
MNRIRPIRLFLLVALVLAVSLAPAAAQPRGGGHATGGHAAASPGPHGGSGHHVAVQVGGWFGPGYPWGWGWGWGGWGPWGPGPWGPYPYYSGAIASLKVQVDPKTAEVYVDGNMAGMVDDFDGVFQSLPVEPGGHEIAVYKAGYKTYVERLYCRPGHTYKLRETLRQLAPGQPDDPRPQPAPDAVGSRPEAQEPQIPGMDREPVDRQPVAPEALNPEPRVPAEQAAPAAGNFGLVAIRVQPADAEVLIDDETWRGPQGAERLVVYLKPGTHRIEIRKEGFDPFVTSVEIKKGQTSVLNVSLGRIPLV